MKRSIKVLLRTIYTRALLKLPWPAEFAISHERHRAFLSAWHLNSWSGLQGDYFEFGVCEGVAFDQNLRSAAKVLKKNSEWKPRFFAFDSFRGLPEAHVEFDSPIFKAGQYQSTQKRFERTISRSRRGRQVHVIEDFYKNSLTAELYREHNMQAAALVNIDCDLYESTLQALRFVAPLLRTGSVLYFDDWFCAQGDMQKGEALACEHWLQEFSHIGLIDYGVVRPMGKMFVVNIKTENKI